MSVRAAPRAPPAVRAAAVSAAQGVLWALRSSPSHSCLLCACPEKQRSDPLAAAHRRAAPRHAGSPRAVALPNLSPATRAGTLRPFGLDGWRFAFVILGAISACIGVVNFFFSADPRCPRGDARPESDAHKEEVSLASAMAGMRSVLCVPTFLIVVFQARPCPSDFL